MDLISCRNVLIYFERPLQEELENLRERVEDGRLKDVKSIIAKAAEIVTEKHGKRYFDYEVKDGKFRFWLKGESIAYEEKLDRGFIIKTIEVGRLCLKYVVVPTEGLNKILRAIRRLKIGGWGTIQFLYRRD